MPLIILGLLFVIGLFVYYMFSTSEAKQDHRDPKKKMEDDGIKEEENVIYLPNDLEKVKDNRNIKR